MPSPQVRPPCVIPPAAPCRDWCQGHGGMPRLGQAITWLHVTLSACPTAGRGGPFPGSSPVLLLIPSALGSSAALHAKPRSLLSRIGSGGQCHQVATQGGRPLPPTISASRRSGAVASSDQRQRAISTQPAGRLNPAAIAAPSSQQASRSSLLGSPSTVTGACAHAPTALVSLLPSTCNAQGRRTVASRHG